MDLETLAIRYETLGEDEVRGSLDRITDSTRQMTLTQMEAIKANDALAVSQETAATATAAHGFQVGRLRQDLGSLVGRLTGTNLAIDRVGGALGAMAIGNVAIIAVLAGIAALAFGYEKLSLSLKGVTADQEKAIEEIEKAQKLKDQSGKLGQADTGLQAEIGKAQAKIDDLKKQLAEVKRVSTGPGLAVGTGTEQIAELQAQLDALQKVQDQKLALLKDTNTKLIDETQKHDLAVLSKQAEALSTLIRDGIATKKEREKALAEEKDYFARATAAANAGNDDLAAEYAKLGEILKGAFDKADKVKKEKLPGLSDFLAEERAEAAAMKETHDLQVRLEQDSADKTAEKYAKIEALDRAYLVEVGSLFGFESSEYDAMLKEMEEHRKQHTDAQIKEYQREITAENQAADRQSIEDEARMKKRMQEAEKIAKDTANLIGEAFKAGLGKGGNIGKGLGALGDGMLKQLGGIFIAMGEKSVAASPALALIRAGLSNIFTAPEASLAGGLALIALGEALDAIGSGGGGGGGGGGGPVGAPAPVTFNGSIGLGVGGNAASLAGGITPVTPVNMTIIGPQDATAQRQIMELIANAQRRNF